MCREKAPSPCCFVGTLQNSLEPIKSHSKLSSCLGNSPDAGIPEFFEVPESIRVVGGHMESLDVFTV